MRGLLHNLYLFGPMLFFFMFLILFFFVVLLLLFCRGAAAAAADEDVWADEICALFCVFYL